MQSAFLDASILRNKGIEEAIRADIKETRIRFEFPSGFNKLRLIEECRALNCLDVSDPDNFDFMYDITLQMLEGKSTFVYFIDDNDVKHEIGRFVITNRFMNLRSIDVIDEYPVIVNWLVEFVASLLGKKYPRSLQDYRATMSEREERMKKSSMTEEEVVITSSQLN